MILITDRTSQDVARWRELHDKGWAAMDDAERTEWLGQMKGRYNYEDVYRVGNIVRTLSERLHDMGYLNTQVTIKTDWTHGDTLTRDDFCQYLRNIAILRDSMPVYPGTPSAPTINQQFDYNKANDLEQILFDVNQISRAIPQSWYYAGEINFGEV